MSNVEERERRETLWGIAWPGHPHRTAVSREELSLRDEPERWALLSVRNDPDADYSYDDLALMERDDGRLALVRTTGCSCPSPTETWGVVAVGEDVEPLIAAARAEQASWGRDAPLRGPWIKMMDDLLTLSAQRR